MNPDDFDIAEIEQMEPEFEECRICEGFGLMWNGVEMHRCTVCHGTGEVVKEGEHEFNITL